LCRISNFVYPRLSDSVLQYYSSYLQWSWSVEMLARITNKVLGMFWRLNLRTGTVWHCNADACKIQLKHFPPQRDMASVWIYQVINWGATVTQSRVRFPMVPLQLFIEKSFLPHYGPGVDSVSNGNEYQEYFLGGKGGRCVRQTILPPLCAVVMKSDSLILLEPSLPVQACNGIALPFLLKQNN
jgi:hypothetical protein